MTTAQAAPAWSEATRLAVLDAYGILDTPIEAAFDAIVRLVADLLDAPIAAINFIAGDRQWFKAEVGLGVRQMPLDDSICKFALLESHLMVVPDTTADGRFACNPLVTGAPGLRFYAGTLLRSPEGIPLGTLCVLDLRPRPEGITVQQRLALRTLGDQVMALLELRRARHERDAAAQALQRTRAELAETRRAAHALRGRLDALLAAAPVGIAYADRDGALVLCNDELERLWGACPPAASVAGYAAWKGWWADHTDRHGRLVQPHEWAQARALHGERADGDVVEIEPFDAPGTRRTVIIRAAPVRDSDGGVAGSVTAVTDVTREVQAETAARAGQQRYHTVLKSIDVGFCVIEMIYDGDGDPYDYRIVEVNDAFARQTGLADAAGRTIRELVPRHDIRWSRIYGRVARTGLPVRVEQHTANLGRWLDVYAARMGDAGSHQVAVFLRDITDQRASNETLRELADNLAAANRRQSEFLATLAHELRNPLAPVRTGLDLLRLGADKPDVLARVRPMMERQVNHLVHLVDDLLDVARISSGKVELRKTDVLVRDVVQRAIEMTLPAIEAKRHALHVDAADEDLVVRADATRLAQVVGNLLANAAKYTPQGGRVTLRVRPCGGQVQIEVADTGIGIPPEALPRIFDMFTQVGRHPEQESGGLGIGLHLVRQMTELHGGEVSARSPGAGRGSTFAVALPLVAGGAAGHTAADAAPRPAPAGRRILVADDNADAAALLADLLGQHGHTVAVVGNGHAALEAAARMQPDLALLDIGMPGLNGHEVARRLRADPATQATRLVALSGWGTEGDRIRSLDAGFDVHLTKPVELQALLDIVAAG